MRITQFIIDLKYNPREAFDTIVHMLLFAVLAMVIGYFIPLIYYRYFDNRNYYDIVSPITVENKKNIICTYVNAYVNRKVMYPIFGTSVRQLTLIREKDGKSVRMRSYTTNIQADVGDGVMIAHWPLPCDVPYGTYYFEGTVKYEVRGLTKYTHFYTENFDIVATSAAELELQIN